MVTFKPRTGWLCLLVLTICLTLLAALYGCGGVGTGGTGTLAGVGTGGTGTLTSVTGKVADGYLWKATVFLDKNGNYKLDDGEPSAVSGGDGSYTLTVDQADLGKYPIVALAIKDVTIDMTTGLRVTGSYVLSTPKETVSGTGAVFISPISSLLREMMETKLYATMTDAMVVLRARLSLAAGTDVTADYLATQNTMMQTTAANMAAIMASQSQVVTTTNAAAAVDVNRYRGMMGALFTTMSSVRTATTQTAVSAATTSVTTAVTGITQTTVGQPYRNMSSSFRNMMR